MTKANYILPKELFTIRTCDTCGNYLSVNNIELFLDTLIIKEKGQEIDVVFTLYCHKCDVEEKKTLLIPQDEE